MPERGVDNESKWAYPTVYPGANMKLNPNAIRMQDGLVEAVGVDGRFLGAIRPFPGMADESIHGVPKPTTGVTTIESVENVVFAKYASMQKGVSPHVLKGIVYIADNPAGTNKAVYFAYRDSEDDSSDVVMLEDLQNWDDFKITSLRDYDFTSLGRYIYSSKVGDISTTVSSYDDKKAPYNKAYFWDWKINDWDTFVSGFRGRFMGVHPERVLATPLNEDTATDAYDTETIAGDGVGDGPLRSNSHYTFGVQFISRKHNLRSPVRWATTKTLSSGVDHSLRYDIDRGLKQIEAQTGGGPQQLRGDTNEMTHLLHWSIPHFDGFRLLRSTDDGLGLTTTKYAPAQMYENDEYIPFGLVSTGSGTSTLDFNYRVTGPHGSAGAPTIFSEGAIVQQPQFDPFLDVFGPAPRLKRIRSYDGLLIGVVSVEEPGQFDAEQEENEQTPEAIVWSTLVKPEPENFPPENYYQLDNPAERILSLESAGDHLFAVTNSSIYRITRSGGSIGVNKLASAVGAMSRHGATGVGGSLFVVTASGVKEVDGNSGGVKALSVLDRVILDDSEWAGTLEHVHVEYDAKIGALIFLNTSKKEAYLLWEATGAVTKLEDVPWVFLTSGPDVKVDGPQRTYFILSDGTIHTIDGSRQMGKRSMCGTAANETVNGTVTSDSAGLVDSAANFPANCVGHKVYLLSGDRKGEIYTVSSRDSDTTLSLSGLAGNVVTGTRYAIAPVITRITLPQLVGQGGEIDPFVRKIAKTMSVAFSDLAGETSGVNGKVVMGVKQNLTTLIETEADIGNVPDQSVGSVNAASTRALPFIEFRGGNLDYEVQAVLVKGVLGRSEAQSRQ